MLNVNSICIVKYHVKKSYNKITFINPGLNVLSWQTLCFITKEHINTFFKHTHPHCLRKYFSIMKYVG